MTADQLRQYDRENVQYVEFMVSFTCPNEREQFRAAVRDKPEDAAKLAALEASGLGNCVAARRSVLEDNIARIRTALACDPQDTQPGCRVTFRFIAQILRDTPLDDVFISTAIAAALIRVEPMVVALNYVQPEDYLVARRDYTRHMEIIRFLAADVPVALHAGELWIGLVPPEDLTFHIRQAVEIAGARRIGHGVALAFERRSTGLLAEMRRTQVAVEINLTSNDVILGVRGKDHPLTAYLAAGVPVVHLDRRCRRIPHRPHQRIFPRCARLPARLPDAEGDRPQCLDPLLPRCRAKAQGIGSVRPVLRRFRAVRGKPAIAAPKRAARSSLPRPCHVEVGGCKSSTGCRSDGSFSICHGGMMMSR